MEIPRELKGLYKHWDEHTSDVVTKSELQLPEEMLWFVSERMRIWEKKYLGNNPPYTSNEILQKYRFCNIYRELDKQTIEIHKHLKNLRDDFPLWLLNVAFHRFICKPDTVKKIGLLNFDQDNNEKVYKRLLDMDKPKYGVPYVFPISVIQKSEYPTREKFFCFYLPKKMLAIAEIIQDFNNITINEALKEILPAFGFNFKFHWTEILIDVAYQYPDLIDLYKDFYVGPGAIPTAKFIDPDNSASEIIDQCIGLEPRDFPFLTFNGKHVILSAENWEGVFCEYRKYSNLRKGKGRIRKFS